MNPFTHTHKNEVAGWIIIIIVVIFLMDLILYVLYRSNWDMISNAVFVMPLIVSILLDRKPVLMLWPNDSILNQACSVLIELIYEEKGIQHFEM